MTSLICFIIRLKELFYELFALFIVPHSYRSCSFFIYHMCCVSKLISDMLKINVAPDSLGHFFNVGVRSLICSLVLKSVLKKTQSGQRWNSSSSVLQTRLCNKDNKDGAVWLFGLRQHVGQGLASGFRRRVSLFVCSNVNIFQLKSQNAVSQRGQETNTERTSVRHL